MKQAPKKQPRPHQREAIKSVLSGFAEHDRGKLIMACGTGKTLTGLKIAEGLTQGKGNVLVLVPSISLLNQTLSEWAAQCAYPYTVYGICSDPKASKITEDEIIDTMVPATTDVDTLSGSSQTATAIPYSFSSRPTRASMLCMISSRRRV